eukprot:UN04294
MIDSKENQLITLQLWDTAGQERFQSLGNAFYRGADACILVYDITNQPSFNRIQTWKNNFLHQSNPANPDSFPFLLFGNKSDLETSRQVSTEQVAAYANKEKCMKFYETSALSGQNLEVGIRLIANVASQNNGPHSYNPQGNDINNVDLGDDDQQTQGQSNIFCCQII